MAEPVPSPFARAESALGTVNDLLLLPMTTLLVVEFTAKVDPAQLVALEPLQLAFSACFFAEWLVGLLATPDRRAYLVAPARLADLISSLPFGLVFQSARVVRLARILRVLRLMWRARRLQARAGKLLHAVSLVAATVFSGALALRLVEPESVPTLGDSLWWSVVTVSTVGYGDITPNTVAGRFVASILLVFGVGVFGYVAGFTSGLIDDPEEEEILRLCRRLEEKVDRLVAEKGGDGGLS